MLEQVSTSVKFLAFYTASKQGKTGLTVTIDIYDPSGSQIVTGGSATAVGGGLYSYTLSSNNSSEGEYAAIFKTTDSTVDSQHIPSLWVLGRAGVENLDAATSTRLPSSSYAAAPSVTAIRTEMDSNSTKLANLDATISSRSTLTTGDLPSVPTAASVATAVWSASTKEITGGTVDTLTNSPDVPTESEIAAQVRTELSVELGRIDQAISTRLAASAYTAPSTPPTASAIADEVRVELATELANLDAPVSGATAPSAATVASQVRTELTAELAKVSALNTDRLANCATTAIVGNLIAQAQS